jgi:hypothetical protein
MKIATEVRAMNFVRGIMASEHRTSNACRAEGRERGISTRLPAVLEGY